MSIRRSLLLLQDLAKKNGLSTPYIVGGVPRNAVLGGPHELTDIDITTGDADVYNLAHLFAKEVGKSAVQADDNHIIVHDNEVKYDFSKNFKYPNIDELLAAKGINKPTDMQREAYSRDFTVNTLMFSPDYKDEVDVTGKARKDIQARILDCPVSCDVSFSSDPKRMLRAYYFRAKYGFQFSENVRRALKKYMPLLESINTRYSSEMLNKILRESPETLGMLIEDGALQHLPMTKLLSKRLVENKRLLEVI